jgi:hypothetical protein
MLAVASLNFSEGFSSSLSDYLETPLSGSYLLEILSIHIIEYTVIS